MSACLQAEGGSTANGTTPTVAIVITTRNRRECLRVVLSSCVCQDYPSLQVVVYDDLSDDGTKEMVRTEFPSVVVRSTTERKGYIFLRNKGYEETRAKYVISIDDDAWFTNPETVSTVVRQAEQDPRIGAIAIPYLEASSVESPRQAPVPGRQLKSFVGTAHMCRSSAVLEVGGYRNLLVHQGEERDLCIRLRSAGWTVELAAAPPIVHAPSPARDRDRMHKYGVRNQILFDFFYTPWCLLPLVITAHSSRLLFYRKRASWTFQTLRFLAIGLRDAWVYREYRTPLSLSAYRAHTGLPGHGPVYMQRTALPPPCIREVVGSP